MGIYDLVAGQQVKATPDPQMRDYEVGDEVPLSDGCYITYEGAFIVTSGRVVAATETLFDKWGDKLTPSEILDGKNHIVQAIRTIGIKKITDERFGHD